MAVTRSLPNPLILVFNIACCILRLNVSIPKVKAEHLETYVEQQVTKDINDAIESLEYEINTLYTSNGQTHL
jgi:anaerobic ribonucleoside-triphosphate reductase